MPQPPPWNSLGFERRRRRRKSAFLLAKVQEGWRQNNKPTGRCKHPAHIPPSEWCSSGRDEEAFLIEGKKKKKRGLVPFREIFFPRVKTPSQARFPLFSLFIFLLPFTSMQRGKKPPAGYCSPKWVTGRLPNESCQSAKCLGSLETHGLANVLFIFTQTLTR